MSVPRPSDGRGPRRTGTANRRGDAGLMTLEWLRSDVHSGRRLPRRGDAGLMTLEWLLIVGAVAGLAATSALTVQRVVDDTAEVRVEPGVRFIDAEIAAAAAASDATAWRRDQVDDPNFDGIVEAILNDPNVNEYVPPAGAYDVYSNRCTDVAVDFDDVVDAPAVWYSPDELGFADIGIWPGIETSEDLEEALLGRALKSGARCEVTADV